MRLKLMLAACLLWSYTISSSAQTSFGNEIPIKADANGARAMDFADLNGDGELDVLLASQRDNKVAWYENLGNGQLGPQKVITRSAFGASVVRSADFDGDGDLDVLSASFDDNKVAWYENDGEGNFGAPIVITINANNVSLANVADLDNDGDQDIYFNSSNSILWYENDGSGNFDNYSAISSLNTSSSLTEVYAEDMDGDNDLDMVYASFGWQAVGWAANDGAGNFGELQLLVETFWPVLGAMGLYVGDLDNDGDNDVVYQARGTSQLSLLTNNGDGSFEDQGSILNLPGVTNSTSAADLDGDGLLDLVIPFSQINQVVWAKNTGNGNFNAYQPLVADIASPDFAYLADVDRDNDFDIFLVSSIDSKAAWLVNDGSGNFDIQKNIASDQGFIKSMMTNDLDGDGDLDILCGLISAFFESKVTWIENLGNGRFDSQKVVSEELGGTITVYAADIDGDGDNDVLSASVDDGKIAWYENEGSGTWGEQQVIFNRFGAQFVYASDLDGDNDLDVLAAFEDELLWFENDGEKNFSLGQRITKGAQVVYAHDLDGDGDQDMIYLHRLTFAFTGSVEWRENDGSGNFGEEKDIASVSGLFSRNKQELSIVDMDADGDLDVLLAALSDNEIVWYANDGAGNFSDRQVLRTGVAALQAVFPSDLDNDGDIDMFSASTVTGEVAWYENDGSLSFGDRQLIDTKLTTNSSGLLLASLGAGDLDKDGDIDVLVGSDVDGKIVWYNNSLLMTSTQEQSEPLKPFTLYPNPSSEFFTIKSPGSISKKLSYEIFNAQGQRVHAGLINQNEEVVPCKAWGSGIYFYQLRQKGQIIQQGKLIKH